MKNIPLLIGTILVTVALIFGAMLLLSNSSSTSEQVVDSSQLMGGSDNSKGASEASVEIVEFSDFQCPACASVEPLIQSVADQYPEDVKLIYRHFPLSSIHLNALLAAQASEVAAEYGKFWPMHDLLFANQEVWAEMSGEELINQFVSYAEQLEIDKNEFSTKIESQEVKQRVLDDLSVANSLNLRGTPTIFVNGFQTSAPQLQATVESYLAN